MFYVLTSPSRLRGFPRQGREKYAEWQLPRFARRGRTNKIFTPAKYDNTGRDVKNLRRGWCASGDERRPARAQGTTKDNAPFRVAGPKWTMKNPRRAFVLLFPVLPFRFCSSFCCRYGRVEGRLIGCRVYREYHLCTPIFFPIPPPHVFFKKNLNPAGDQMASHILWEHPSA